MLDIEEFWNQVHPSRLTPRLDPPVEEVRDSIDPELLTRLLHRMHSTSQQQRAQEPLTEEEEHNLRLTKAKICIVTSRMMLGPTDPDVNDVEEQAYDLMHLPDDQLMSTCKRILRRGQK